MILTVKIYNDDDDVHDANNLYCDSNYFHYGVNYQHFDINN